LVFKFITLIIFCWKLLVCFPGSWRVKVWTNVFFRISLIWWFLPGSVLRVLRIWKQMLISFHVAADLFIILYIRFKKIFIILVTIWYAFRFLLHDSSSSSGKLPFSDTDTCATSFTSLLKIQNNGSEIH